MSSSVPWEFKEILMGANKYEMQICASKLKASLEWENALSSIFSHEIIHLGNKIIVEIIVRGITRY
jgi:hypothetical protein